MTLFLDNEAIAPLLDAGDFVAAQDVAYRDFAAGRAAAPPRIDLQGAPDAEGRNYQLGLALGVGARGYAVLRIKSDVTFARETPTGRRKEKFCVAPGTFMGLLLVFDAASGALLAVLHDGLIQKLRVGADSALGIRYMARQDASVLGVLGAGGMARAHVAAVAAVRRLSLIRVYSPTPANRDAFVAEIRERHGIAAEACATPEEVYAADIVSSCANAIGPMIQGRLLRPGTHVTCIGGTLDAEANARLDRALRFGDASAPAEHPDWLAQEECLTFAIGGRKAEHGAGRRFAEPPPGRLVAFRDLLADPSLGRTDPAQVTFSERGNIHGIQFAAVAPLVFEKALAAGVGQKLPPSLFLQSVRN